MAQVLDDQGRRVLSPTGKRRDVDTFVDKCCCKELPEPPILKGDKASCKDFCGKGGGRKRSECCSCPCGGRKDVPRCFKIQASARSASGTLLCDDDGSYMDFGSGVSVGATQGPGTCIRASCDFPYFLFPNGACSVAVTFYDYNPTPSPHFDSRAGTLIIGFSSLGASVIECGSDPTMDHAPRILLNATGGFDGMCVLQEDIYPNGSYSFEVVGDGQVDGCEGGGVGLGPPPGKTNPLFSAGSVTVEPWCSEFGCIEDPKPSCMIPITNEVLKCDDNMGYYIEVKIGVDGSGDPIYTAETGTLAREDGCGLWSGGTLASIVVGTTPTKPNGDVCCPDCDCEDCYDCGDGSLLAECQTCWLATVGAPDGTETLYLGVGSCPPASGGSGTNFRSLAVGFA